MAIEGLCAYLRILKSTLCKFVWKGKVPWQKIDRHW